MNDAMDNFVTTESMFDSTTAPYIEDDIQAELFLLLGEEEPSSETETPDASPKDSATKLQSASESEPSWMPPVSQPVPNFPKGEPSSASPRDPTTKLQSATKSDYFDGSNKGAL